MYAEWIEGYSWERTSLTRRPLSTLIGQLECASVEVEREQKDATVFLDPARKEDANEYVCIYLHMHVE